MTIIGYAFDSDMHCADCTQNALAMGFICKDGASERDMHGLPERMVESNGNSVHPIFSTDEQLGMPYCGRCRRPL